MPDYTKNMRAYLSKNNTMRDTSGSTYTTPDQVDRDYGDNLKYERTQIAESMKEQSKKLAEDLKQYGYDDKKIAEVKGHADTITQMFNVGKAAVNMINQGLSGGSSFIQAGITDMEAKKKEILNSVDADRRQTNAIKSNTVVNDATGELERFDEQGLDSKSWADKFMGMFGMGSDKFGNKKLTIGYNPMGQNNVETTHDKDGKATYSMKPNKDGVVKKEDKWFFYLDKDEAGSDVWHKTKYKDHEEFKKIGDKVVGAYGVAPFKTGFWREFNNQIGLTSENLTRNLVNFGEATASLTTGDGGLMGLAGIKTRKGIQDAADKFRDEKDVTVSKAGTGDSFLEWIGNGAGSGVSSLIQMGALGNAVGALDKVSKFQALTNFGAGSVLNFNEAYESALKSGLDKQSAATVGMLTGAINGLIESSVGTNNMMKWATGGGDRVLARSVLKELDGDLTGKGINRVLNAWRSNSTNKINDLFATPMIGTALEEGIEEFTQTFSQKGVENLYDVFFADQAKEGEGKFGTKFFSKESLKEGLEAAFFGALIGAGMGGFHKGLSAVTGAKQHGDGDVIPTIVDGGRTKVEAIVKDLHSKKLISDTQKESYLQRVDQLDTLYKENKGTFATLDENKDYDEKTTNRVKSFALNHLANNLAENAKLEKLSKKIAEVTNDKNIATPDKQKRLEELNKDVRLTTLKIKFTNDILEKEFTPQADNKIIAAENSFLNDSDVTENKWQRFVRTDHISSLDNKIAEINGSIASFEAKLNDPTTAVGESPIEVGMLLEYAKSNVEKHKEFKKNTEADLARLVDEYGKITSPEFQAELKAKQEAGETVAPVEALVAPTAEVPAVVAAPIIIPPNMSGDENENNSNKQEDDANKPTGQMAQLEEEYNELNERLNNPEAQPDEIEAINTRLTQIGDEMKALQESTSKVADASTEYLDQLKEKIEVYDKLESEGAFNALNSLKTEMEAVVPGMEANGVDVTEVKQLYNAIVKKLQGLQEEIALVAAEKQRILDEAKKNKENNEKPVMTSINFFDRLQRTKTMNSRKNYYTDQEVKDLFLNTPMEEILKDVTVEFLDAAQFGNVGGEIGSWNDYVKYVNPSKIVMFMYKGKALGNIQQFDGMKVDGKLLTEDLTDEEFAKIALNVSRDEFEASKARSLKINTLLNQKGKLSVEDLQSIGFIFNWNGDFDVDTSIGRTLVKDLPQAQLEANGGHPYIYDTVNNLPITSGTVNMRKVEGVPSFPAIKERYLVLVKANNGKYYWVGAQNQVLSDSTLKSTYDMVMKAVQDYKAIPTTDTEAQKNFVTEINKKLESTVHVALEDANLTFTTPNATNKNFTLRLRTGKKGAYKYEKVELDPTKIATFESVLTGLNLNRTQVRTPLANNAPAKITVGKLAISLKPTLLKNDELHKSITFGVNPDKLNAALTGTTVPETVVAEVPTEVVTEGFNPFEGATGMIVETTEVTPTVPTTGEILDLSEFDADYATMSDEIKAKISDAVRPLVENLPNLTGLKLRGAKNDIKIEIAKYKGSREIEFSIGNAPELSDRVADEQWIKDHLPAGISVKDVEVLMGNIRNNGVTWGAFADSTIYLSQNAAKGTVYHEAFHAVFRLLMNNKQIRAAYAIAEKKYGKPSAEDIKNLRMSSTVYLGYTEKELYNLVLEEKMANEYKKFQLDIANRANSSTGLKSLWNKILNWVNFISAHNDSLEAIFHNINRGGFKKASYQSNIFSSFANQEKVFEIYKKGEDAMGNDITTTQAEAAGVVAVLTKHLLNTIIKDKIDPKDWAAKDAILDKLLADKADFYSIDKNGYYETYLESKGLLEDEAYIDEMEKDLLLKKSIYTLPENIGKIKRDVFSKIKMYEISEELTEEQQAEIDEKGDQYDVSPWSIGGETSFSKVLRQYISLTTVPRFDKYGQEYEEAVDFKKIYRGLIRALAGTEEANILPRFAAMADFDEDIKAVYTRLTNDLGLTPENTKITNSNANYDLWRKFVTAFNNEKVGWYTVLYSDTESRLIESNTMSNKEVQFNDWFQDFVGTFEDSLTDPAIRNTINDTADNLQMSVNTVVTSKSEARIAAKRLQEEFAKLSIKLSEGYLTYSILKNSDYKALDAEAIEMLSAFAGVPGLYDDNNIPFIVEQFKRGSNPFIAGVETVKGKQKETGAVTRIKQLAEDNAIFDPTIGENSFQNADGKNVYSIIKPSFGLVKLRWIADAEKRAEILKKDKEGDNFIDPLEDIRLNHLLADPNVDILLKSLFPSMIDGSRKATLSGEITPTSEGEGVTFGKFNGQTYLLSDLRMFLSNRKSVNQIDPETGEVVKLAQTAMFNINQMEASNTAYGVFLPVQDFKTINNDALNKLFNYFAQEVIRINNVAKTFDKDGKPLKGVTRWKGYNNKTTDRGSKLIEFAGFGLEEHIKEIADGTKAPQEVYDALVAKKELIVGLIKDKVADDIAEYKDVLIANDIISEASSELPAKNLGTYGYIDEKVKANQNNLDTFITDFYLNAYINTLGINNLMLDNYARKVKDATDWFKRAKGIIGSGPDLGEGHTVVAVYKDPVSYIDPKNLQDVDKKKLMSDKETQLKNDGIVGEEYDRQLKEYEEQVEKGHIDVADAQSYVTLAHKILQLKQWGRFPAPVAAVYKKIENGENISFTDYKVLVDNNAALNSTKTVSYDGEFYFKLSELPLSPRLVGRIEKDGSVIMENGMPKFPKKGFEYLFNMYHNMVKQGVDQALPETASKMATITSADHADDGNFDFTGHTMTIENKFKRLQVETPTGKLKIVHGTQLIQLIGSEQKDSVEVKFPYNTDIKTIGDLRRYYRELMADSRYESFKQALAFVKDPLSGEFNSKEMTKKFYNTVVESGGDETMLGFFTPDQSGERQFNWNLGPIVNKAEQLFLAHFSKGILAQKVPGLKVSLVSDAGIYKEDGTKLKHMALDEDGNYYSECMLPAFANELLGSNPSDERIKEVLKMFGVRIPTQDKHSMMSLKVVGFLPLEYGSVGIFPKEIVYLSGADFDIDSEFIHRKEFYSDDKGNLIPYGLVTSDEDKYREWRNYEIKHNKMLMSKFKEVAGRYAEDEDLTDKDVTKLKQANRESDIDKAFAESGLPSTLEEYVTKQPINIAAVNNALLEGQIKMLTNDHIRNGAAMIPSSMTTIKEVAEVIAEKLGLNNARTVSPNTPIARFRANRNNMEGKDGIAPVAIANSVHSFLSSNDVKLLGSAVRVDISGRQSSGFDGDFTIGSSTNRKNDNISTLLSAMTDNAKEQLAKKLNLSFNKDAFDTLPVAVYMLALGYTMEETMLFLNLPTIRAFSTQDKILNSKLDDKMDKLMDHILSQFKNKTQDEKNEAIRDYRKQHIKPLSLALMIDTLNENDLELDDMLHLQEALSLFKSLQTQAGAMNAVSGVMKLNKGMGSTFDEAGKLALHLESLQLDFIPSYITEDVESYDDLIIKLINRDVIRLGVGTKNKYMPGKYFPAYQIDYNNPDSTPFDARIAMINDQNSMQNIIIHAKVLETSRKFFLLNTNVFHASHTITGIPSKELVPFYMDKAYRTFLENLPEDTLEKSKRYDRFYNAVGYMINKTDDNIGLDLAKLKKDAKHKHNPLIKMLQYARPKKGSGSGIIQIMFPTRVKAEGDFYKSLNDGFKALFINKDTNEFANRLFFYSYFKDGLQFKNRSFINTLPTWVFKDISKSLDALNNDFSTTKYDSYASIKDGIVPTMIDLFNSLALNSKTVSKLPFKSGHPPIIKALTTEDGLVTSFDDKIAESLNVTSYDALVESTEQLIEVSKGALLEGLLRFKSNRYSLKYRLVSKVEKTFPNEPYRSNEISGVRVTAIKGFDKSGNPKDYSLEELVEYALKNNGKLPRAYEITTQNITPIVENGLNSTIADATFIGKLAQLKKDVADKPENLGVNQAVEEIPEGPPEGLFAEEQPVEDYIVSKAIENLENQEKSVTFVGDNPFNGAEGKFQAEEPSIDAADAIAKMAAEKQAEIDRAAKEQEDINQIKRDTENRTDVNGNKDC